MLYQLVSLDKRSFEKYRILYSPYASIASLYLWEISRGVLGDKFLDPITK